MVQLPQESKALIDVLTLIIYADDDASTMEQTELTLVLHQLPWAMTDTKRIDSYTQQSVQRAKTYQSHEQVERISMHLASVLIEEPKRHKAFKMAASMVYANWSANEKEREALVILAQAFEMPMSFTHALLSKLSNTNMTQTPDRQTMSNTIKDIQSNTVRDVLTNEFLDHFFADLFKGDDLKTLSEEASMAFVDALTLALVADGYPEEEEVQEFKSQLEQLPFSVEDRSFVQARVEITINTLRRFDPQGQQDYIRTVGEKIPSIKLKERALRMAIAITNADFAITRNEHAIIHMIAKGFKIDGARTKTLIQEVKTQQQDGFFS